jgi:hypothetical protein
MDESLVREIIDGLISSLEPLETQTTALMQFVKDKGIARDDALAPYVEQAAKASNVRWRAFRLRTLSLINSAMTPSQEERRVERQGEEKEASGETNKISGDQENRSNSPDGAPKREPGPAAEPSATGTKLKEEGQRREGQAQERKDAA